MLGNKVKKCKFLTWKKGPWKKGAVYVMCSIHMVSNVSFFVDYVLSLLQDAVTLSCHSEKRHKGNNNWDTSNCGAFHAAEAVCRSLLLSFVSLFQHKGTVCIKDMLICSSGWSHLHFAAWWLWNEDLYILSTIIFQLFSESQGSLTGLKIFFTISKQTLTNVHWCLIKPISNIKLLSF